MLKIKETKNIRAPTFFDDNFLHKLVNGSGPFEISY